MNKQRIALLGLTAAAIAAVAAVAHFREASFLQQLASSQAAIQAVRDDMAGQEAAHQSVLAGLYATHKAQIWRLEALLDIRGSRIDELSREVEKTGHALSQALAERDAAVAALETAKAEYHNQLATAQEETKHLRGRLDDAEHETYGARLSALAAQERALRASDERQVLREQLAAGDRRNRNNLAAFREEMLWRASRESQALGYDRWKTIQQQNWNMLQPWRAEIGVVKD